MSSQARILVVDDNRAVVKIIQGVLQRQGFEVLTAFDGVEGLEKAIKEKPNLIILDIVMPGLDGYQVCRRLQCDPATLHIPVLMLTVKGQINEEPRPWEKRDQYSRIQERMAGFDAGAVDFLSKPVTAKELIKRVKSLLWFGKA
jgi:DNA-binding response OmpR family regulator